MSGHGPKEGLSWSLKREPSTRSPDDKEEDYDREGVEEGEGGEDVGEYGKGEGDEVEGENEEKCEGEEDEGEGDERAIKGGSSGSPGDGYTCPFILPMI